MYIEQVFGVVNIIQERFGLNYLYLDVDVLFQKGDQINRVC